MVTGTNNETNPAYQEGVDAGFDIAESHIRHEMRKFYKSLKRGLLKAQATYTGTFSNHKCNCNYCDLDEKEPSKI